MMGVANPSRRDVAFAVGDRVYLSTQHLPLRVGARKLAAKWAGPYPVEERITEQAYRLGVPPAWRVHPVFHTSQLKACAGRPTSEAPVLLEDG